MSDGRSSYGLNLYEGRLPLRDDRVHAVNPLAGVGAQLPEAVHDHRMQGSVGRTLDLGLQDRHDRAVVRLDDRGQSGPESSLVGQLPADRLEALSPKAEEMDLSRLSDLEKVRKGA